MRPGTSRVLCLCDLGTVDSVRHLRLLVLLATVLGVVLLLSGGSLLARGGPGPGVFAASQTVPALVLLALPITYALLSLARRPHRRRR